MKQNPLEVEFKFFSTKINNDVLWMNLQKNLLIQAPSLENRDTLLAYLDKVAACDAIKAVVICSSLEESGHQAILQFFQAIKSKQNNLGLQRLCNSYASFILKIKDLNKIVIHAALGNVIPLFLNLSLACDYRIAADDTVYKNSYLDTGVLPIGGGAYFLSKIIGPGKTWELLTLTREYTAREAMAYGIVDRIVPAAGFQAEVLRVAQQFGEVPGNTITGLKRLIQFSANDLKDYLEYENQEFFKIVHQHSHKQAVDPTTWIVL
ncbi:MAG: enoyl-CoA hydratase/isomerase family protein [Desulfosalsimonadaceae bacterium]